MPFFPRAGRQVLSTLFNQVSIKAERDLVLLTAGALRKLNSKVTDTAISDPSDLDPDSGSRSGKKNSNGEREVRKRVLVSKNYRFFLANAVYRIPWGL